MVEARRHEESPREAVIDHLLRVETTEINPLDERICALVGTSANMLLRMIHTGKLVQRTADTISLNNEISVTPTPGLIPKLEEMRFNQTINDLLFDPSETRSESMGYAKQAAKNHYFLDRLGLSLDDPELQNIVGNHLLSWNLKAIEALDLPSSMENVEKRWRIASSADLLSLLNQEMFAKIPAITVEAGERKGFLVGINPDIPFEVKGISYPQEYRDLPEDDVLKVMLEGSPDSESFYGPGEINLFFTKEGMPYTAISCIEPLGLHEEKFLADLREGKRF